MIQRFGPNSLLEDHEGQSVCRAGAVILTMQEQLAVVTLKSPGIDAHEALFWREFEFKLIADSKKDALKNVFESMTCMYELPTVLTDHQYLCDAAIWPTEISTTRYKKRHQLYSNEDLRRQAKIGQVVHPTTQILLDGLGTDQPSQIVPGVMIATLYNSSFMNDCILGASVINDAAQLLGFCLSTRISQTSGDTELVILPSQEILQESRYQMWAPPGTHWLDLMYRTQSFHERAALENTLDLGKAP